MSNDLQRRRATKETFADRPEFPAPRSANRMHQDWQRCARAACGRWYAAPCKEVSRGRWIFCSLECSRVNAIETGKFRGENNPRWLGGVSNDNMRYRRRQKERHPLEESARQAVAHAIRAGRLKRQPCERCGAEVVQAHHDDYERPLEVRWLCRLHHDEHHAAERRAKRAARVKRIEAKRPPAADVVVTHAPVNAARFEAAAEVIAEVLLELLDAHAARERG